jgi:hypothetical protein
METDFIQHGKTGQELEAGVITIVIKETLLLHTIHMVTFKAHTTIMIGNNGEDIGILVIEDTGVFPAMTITQRDGLSLCRKKWVPMTQWIFHLLPQ